MYVNRATNARGRGQPWRAPTRTRYTGVRRREDGRP